MLAWTCDSPDCQQRQSLPFKGECLACMRHLCEIHVALPHHDCLNDPDPGAATRIAAEQIAVAALAHEIEQMDLQNSAEELHGSQANPLGVIDYSALAQGGMNIHIPITFEDGTKWLARVRRKRFDSPPPALSRMIMQSEICTLATLKEAGVPVPGVHVPPRAADECTNFLFMDVVTGHTCSPPFSLQLSPEQRTALITSYAEASAQIASMPFSGIGSLHRTPRSDAAVGPLIHLDVCQSSPPHYLGPFRTNRDRYLACINLILEQITGEGGVKDGLEEWYYTHLWLKDVVNGIEELGREEPTYIKHADDKGDHVMVNERYEVTGIIDWEWAYIAPKAEAFAAPLAVVDVSAYYDGSNELSAYEVQLAEAYDALGRVDLGDCVRGGKLYQRLNMVLGAEPDLVLLHALQELVYGKKGEEKDTEEWVGGLKARFGKVKDGDASL